MYCISHMHHAGHQVKVFARTGSLGPELKPVWQYQPDLLLATCIVSNDFLEQMVASGKPVVSVMHAPLGLPLDFVFPATVRHGYVAARSLLQAGLASIWYMGALYGSTSAPFDSSTQATGVRAACLDSGRDAATLPVHMVPTESDLPLFVDRFFQNQPRPQAVIAANARIGQRFLVEAQRRGLRVPKDLAIFAVGGEKPCSVSCLAIDNTEIAAQAANLIRMRLQRPNMSPQNVHVSARFVEAGTIPPAVVRHVLKMLPGS